ncbi:MAG: type II toxin-antitoxin system VapC family toxin [bacterium]
MYLIDTNIILELLCDQARAPEVRDFFSEVSIGNIYMTDFTLYSLGIFLFKGEKEEVFQKFIEDMLQGSALNLVRIPPLELPRLFETAQKYNLDFDDAYQYTAAQKNNLTLITFDSDFDNVPGETKTPSEII